MRKYLAMAMLAIAAIGVVGTADAAAATDGVPFGDARHYSRSTSNGQTPVRVFGDQATMSFYFHLVNNSVNDWTASPQHAVTFNGLNPTTGGCHGGGLPYDNCIVVVHNSGQPCGSLQLSHELRPSFGHVHIDTALLAVNLSSVCMNLAQAQSAMCRGIGKALGVQGPAGSTAPCELSTTPSAGDIATLTWLGDSHPGAIHLPAGV